MDPIHKLWKREEKGRENTTREKGEHKNDAPCTHRLRIQTLVIID
jgi:hypothetical protein